MLDLARNPHSFNGTRDPDPMWNGHKDIRIWAGLTERIGRVGQHLSDAESIDHLLGTFAYFTSPNLAPDWLCPNPKRAGRYGYQVDGANPEPGAVIVDAGACNGDMIPDWLAVTGGDCRIYAIEPVTKNDHPAPQVTWVRCGLGRESGFGGITRQREERTRIAVGLGEGGIPIATLDELFADKPFDYIKMDIEGAEIDALNGGRKVLKRYRPTAVICAYHKPSHWVEVPELLHELLSPCKLYAAHDPRWYWNTHYIAVPEERA